VRLWTATCMDRVKLSPTLSSLIITLIYLLWVIYHSGEGALLEPEFPRISYISVKRRGRWDTRPILSIGDRFPARGVAGLKGSQELSEESATADFKDGLPRHVRHQVEGVATSPSSPSSPRSGLFS
jgi:hypothetical protein